MTITAEYGILYKFIYLNDSIFAAYLPRMDDPHQSFRWNA